MMHETDFEKALIWNSDRTAGFLPEEFSNARIGSITDNFFVINICLKNGEMVSYYDGLDHFDTREEAKEQLKELLSEIGEKREQWKYKQALPQKGD